MYAEPKHAEDPQIQGSAQRSTQVVPFVAQSPDAEVSSALVVGSVRCLYGTVPEDPQLQVSALRDPKSVAQVTQDHVAQDPWDRGPASQGQ